MKGWLRDGIVLGLAGCAAIGVGIGALIRDAGLRTLFDGAAPAVALPVVNHHHLLPNGALWFHEHPVKVYRHIWRYDEAHPDDPDHLHT